MTNANVAPSCAWPIWRVWRDPCNHRPHDA